MGVHGLRDRLVRSIRALWLAIGATSLVTAGQLFVAIPAQANVSGTSWVIHAGTNLCLDDTDWSTSQGTRLQLYPCTGNSNQQWRENIYATCMFYFCPGGYGQILVAQIQNVYSGLCLNISGASNRNGTPAIQWGCIPNAVNEQFWIQPMSNGPPYWSIRAPRIGTCLDDPGNSGATYTKLWFYQCNLTAAQIWYASQWVGVNG